MKRIEAIVRPDRVEGVKEALAEFGLRGLTVTDVLGHGVQNGVKQQWRGQEYEVDLLPKVSLVAVVHDHEAKEVCEVIVDAARTGRMGDGKIFVTSVEEVIRIRTGENGAGAL
jgi:nitrogen regulatory protein P-II 1